MEKLSTGLILHVNTEMRFEKTVVFVNAFSILPTGTLLGASRRLHTISYRVANCCREFEAAEHALYMRAGNLEKGFAIRAIRFYWASRFCIAVEVFKHQFDFYLSDDRKILSNSPRTLPANLAQVFMRFICIGTLFVS